MTNIIGQVKADPSGCAVYGVGLRPLTALTGIAGSNPVRGTDVCLSWVLCVVR